MTYNVFGGTLKLALSIYLSSNIYTKVGDHTANRSTTVQL